MDRGKLGSECFNPLAALDPYAAGERKRHILLFAANGSGKSTRLLIETDGDCFAESAANALAGYVLTGIKAVFAKQTEWLLSSAVATDGNHEDS